jgi:hypothetical protein
MNSAPWRWSALLAFALFAPISLPAGGPERRANPVRRRMSADEPLLSAKTSVVRTSPDRNAPALTHVQAGQPLRVLRSWLSPSDGEWLQVEVRTSDLLNVERGWLSVA